VSYSGDPSASGIDAIRFWVQDTGAPELLTDDELEYLVAFSGLDPEVSPIDIAAIAAERIAAKYAGYVTISADGVSYSGEGLQQKYNQLAVSLRKQAARTQAESGVPFIGGLGGGRNFGVAMHDNPEGSYQREPVQVWDERVAGW
jgi:hypothetical protein